MGTPADSIVANQASRSVSVPIIVCSSGNAAARAPSQCVDHRRRIDHERHDVQHQHGVEGITAVRQCQFEHRPEAILARIGEQVERVGDPGFARQDSPQRGAERQR